MKHARNVRKSRKQANMDFGFHTGSGSWPSGWSNPEIAAERHIQDWFATRNWGDAAERQKSRECIREQIADLRAMRAKK